jgi:hypothetical protein
MRDQTHKRPRNSCDCTDQAKSASTSEFRLCRFNKCLCVKAVQSMTREHGIHANLPQFLHQLLQVFLVGLTIGMMRNVVPALAESEFGVPRGSFLLLVAFVVAFGFVKGSMNVVAGRLAERIGRKCVLLLGWLVALPIPVLISSAPTWSWAVFATVLLGINQGLTWSMTQTAKLDVTRVGVLARISAPAWSGPARHRVDRRCLWLHLGRGTVLHRQVVRPPRLVPPERLGYVDLRRWRGEVGVVPLLGSFITEPAAMTLTALMLRPSVSVTGSSTPLWEFFLLTSPSSGGTLTHFVTSPVLMVASTWQ